MANSEKLLKLLSGIIESGVLTSQDLKKEIISNIKFQTENIIEKLRLVPREEFEILKKIVAKQEKEIKNLKKKKRVKIKKAKKS
tara:strand:+ start:238 stop:489 length:252 start_codon:yes stop_codon:yes gene_type:complete